MVIANNVTFDFFVADFPLMNLNDLINVTKILSHVDVSKLQKHKKDDFFIGFAHIKAFIDNHYDCLAVTDIELAIAVNRTSKVPQLMLKGHVSLKDYVDGEIVHKPLGVVFLGKNKNGKMTKFFFKFVMWRGTRTLSIRVFLFILTIAKGI